MFDSLTGAPAWLRFVQKNGSPPVLTGTVGLLAVIATVAVAYHLAIRLAARSGHLPPGRLAGEIAHTIVPLATGYLIAHYYSLLILEGQHTIALLSDPRDTGANWLGTATWTVHTGLITPTGVATLQITLILLGHLLGTILAHDRALHLIPRNEAIRGQLPLLGLMVTYTTVGLLLLFAG